MEEGDAESCCVSACPGSVLRSVKLKCCSFCSSDRPQRLCSPASCPPAAPQQPGLLTLWGLPTLQKPHVRPQEEGRGKCTPALHSFHGWQLKLLWSVCSLHFMHSEQPRKLPSMLSQWCSGFLPSRTQSAWFYSSGKFPAHGRRVEVLDL